MIRRAPYNRQLILFGRWRIPYAPAFGWGPVLVVLALVVLGAGLGYLLGWAAIPLTSAIGFIVGMEWRRWWYR